MPHTQAEWTTILVEIKSHFSSLFLAFVRAETNLEATNNVVSDFSDQLASRLYDTVVKKKAYASIKSKLSFKTTCHNHLVQHIRKYLLRVRSHWLTQRNAANCNATDKKGVKRPHILLSKKGDPSE